MVSECGCGCKWSRPTYFLEAEKEHCSNSVRLLQFYPSLSYFPLMLTFAIFSVVQARLSLEAAALARL
jgi:hypothetical protein